MVTCPFKIGSHFDGNKYYKFNVYSFDTLSEVDLYKKLAKRLTITDKVMTTLPTFHRKIGLKSIVSVMLQKDKISASIGDK